MGGGATSSAAPAGGHGIEPLGVSAEMRFCICSASASNSKSSCLIACRSESAEAGKLANRLLARTKASSGYPRELRVPEWRWRESREQAPPDWAGLPERREARQERGVGPGTTGSGAAGAVGAGNGGSGGNGEAAGAVGGGETGSAGNPRKGSQKRGPCKEQESSPGRVESYLGRVRSWVWLLFLLPPG